MRRIFVVIVAAAVVAVAVAGLRGARPVILLARPVPAVGAATAVQVKVVSAAGVRWFRARLEQGSEAAVLVDDRSVVSRWKFWRPRRREAEYSFLAGRQTMPRLQDGPARLVCEAQSDDLRGARAILILNLVVRTKPPQLSVDTAQHYLQQGGSDLVVFTVAPAAAEAAARVGAHRFRSWPLPGGAPGARFALVAFPYDVPAQTPIRVWARDEAGNEATAGYRYRVFPKRFRTRNFPLTLDFLLKVTREIQPGAGDVLEGFLRINRDLRRRNNQQLSDLRWKTEERFLWREPFRQLADSKVEAQFADRRRYFYQGAQVDEQDHLGFDLAVTANVAVTAANDGKVVFADRLGIYGNCVVLDHGYALQSIYGHLSTMVVKPDQMVKRGEEIGRSGSTGLAGGDHLHFSMQIDGVQVNPVEWWDPRWIQERILSRMIPGPTSGPPRPL